MWQYQYGGIIILATSNYLYYKWKFSCTYIRQPVEDINIKRVMVETICSALDPILKTDDAMPTEGSAFPGHDIEHEDYTKNTEH